MTSVVLTAFLGAVVGWQATGLLLRYALRRELLDIPNHRSSHSTPTPRGGGMSIVLVTLTGIALLTASGQVDREAGLALLTGGALVAGIGWVDDHRGVPAVWRAVVHVAAAVLVVSMIGAPRDLNIGPYLVNLGWAGIPLTILTLVWLTNLFNFMDGIDGIAGVEAASVGLIGAGLLIATGAPAFALVSVLVGASALGFLFWNWSPARIFMGDVGSGFLGFIFGGIAIAADSAGAAPLLMWMLLLGVFIFDATATLVRRMGREKLHEAHRRHAYQRAVQSGISHATVASAVLVLNVFLGAAALTLLLAPSYAILSLGAAAVLVATTYGYVERRHPMW